MAPITELEARLAGPEGAAEHAALGARLTAVAVRLRTGIAAGLGREEFARWSAALAAVDAALAALDSLQHAADARAGGNPVDLFRR